MSSMVAVPIFSRVVLVYRCKQRSTASGIPNYLMYKGKTNLVLEGRLVMSEHGDAIAHTSAKYRTSGFCLMDTGIWFPGPVGQGDGAH